MPTPVVSLRAAAITGLADGAAVATWTDESGNGKNATQATASKQPLYRAGGGTPYVDFDGVDDFLTMPYAFTAGQAFTIYLRVWSTETGATYRNLFDGPSNTAPPMIWFDGSGKVEFDAGTTRSTTAQRGAWVDVAITHPAGSGPAVYYVNGVSVTPVATYSTPAYTPQWFNRAGASTWKGRVSDWQIFASQLTATEVAALPALPASGGTVALSLAGTLPAIQSDLTLASYTDTLTANAVNGRVRDGSFVDESVEPVTPLPAHLTRAARYDKALAYPTPTLVDGRPT